MRPPTFSETRGPRRWGEAGDFRARSTPGAAALSRGRGVGTRDGEALCAPKGAVRSKPSRAILAFSGVVTRFPFALRVDVRFRDLDGMGHVNNAVYFTYIEAARTEYMMKVAGITRLEDVDWIVASASLNFRKAVGYGDSIEVRVRPTKIGTTSYTLYYEIWDAGKNELVA